jgi:hypothetical protein
MIFNQTNNNAGDVNAGWLINPAVIDKLIPALNGKQPEPREPVETNIPGGIKKLFGMFCGCGQPDAAWNAVLTELKRCHHNHLAESLSEHIYPPETGEWYVMAYVLEHCDLTEHGGSVGGSWLTPDGQDAMDFLEKHGVDTDKWPEETE